MNLLKKLLPVLIVIFLSFWAIKPLFTPGFFPIHDDTQIARVFEMTKSLKMGMFPVRWVADLGYGLGYPIFNFYAPLAYYIGSLFNLIGFDALAATKIMMGLGIVLSGVSMYLFVRQLFGEKSAVVGALFYMYAPYHALDIYVRGDVSEFWAYAFIPLVFYALFKVYKTVNLKFVVVAALAYAATITSHNLTAMMVTPFLLFFLLVLIGVSLRKKAKNTVYFLISSFVLGIIISCFYWLPALSEMKYTNVFSLLGGGSHFADHFVCINQLWSSPWGYGGSAPGCVDGLSFMIGKLHILVAIISIISVSILLIFKKHTKDKKKILIVIFSFLGFLFSLFLTLEISKLIWQAIPTMAFFQYPWRFLLMVSFFASILAGSLIWVIEFLPAKKFFPHYVLEISAVIIVALLFLNIKFFVAQTVLQNNSGFYTNEYTLKWTTSKISDEYLPQGTLKPITAKEALQNKQVFSFSQTPIEKTANLISLAGIVVAIIGIILPRKKTYHAN